MTRLLAPIFAFAAAASLGSAIAAPPPGRDWSAVVTPALKGSYVIGNPQAKVKLVEYVSYTCPHCAHFNAESAAVLKGAMVRSGSTSVEIRNAVTNSVDLVATALARCVGPRAFPRYHDAVFANQQAWLDKARAYVEANGAALRKQAPAAQLKTLAQGSGLAAIATGAGATPVAVAQCFATTKASDAAVAVARGLNPAITGTPAFEINGTLVQNVGWAQLEPQLRAAGAK